MSPTTTRTRTRSSSTPPESVEECTRKIDELSKRRRNASATGRTEKGSTPTGGASGSTPTGDVSGGDDAVNHVAVELWNQLFSTSDFMDIAGRDSFHMRVRKLLTEEQQQSVTALIKKDIINRKVDFIKSKETDIPKLRLSLQESFTKIVIRHVRSELGVTKDDTITRIEQLESLDDQAVNRWNIRKDKNTVKVQRFKEAQEGIDELLNLVSNKLEGTFAINLVGTPEHTMTSIGNFLNEVVENERVELPNIIDEEREAGNDDQLIYRTEYDKLPQDVKDCYAEAAKLIVQANQAEQEENDALADYTLICARLNSQNLDGAQLIDLKEKIAGIKELDDLASRIIVAGTFWKYEGIAAPGDNEKFYMDSSVLKRSIDELVRISNTLEDPSLENNPRKLEKEVLNAKDYVKKMRSNLPEYSNVATLRRAIIDTEATIAGCEDVLARIPRRTRRTVSHAASTESGRTF